MRITQKGGKTGKSKITLVDLFGETITPKTEAKIRFATSNEKSSYIILEYVFYY